MESRFLLELSLILLMTKFFGIIFKRIHLPQVVGALLAGLVLGPAVLGIVGSDTIIATLAEVGVILLMFTAGLETNLKQLRLILKPALIIAALGASLQLAGGWALAHFFGFDMMASLFLGVALMSTSVSVTVQTLQEMGKIKSKTGTTILGAAIIDDIIGIIVLSLLMSSNSGDNGSFLGGNALTLLKIALFFVFAWLGSKLINLIFEHLIKYHGYRQRLSIFSLAFCFFLAYAAELLGIASITGAYFAGLALSSSNAEKYIEERTHILSYLLFSPIFFVSIGLNVVWEQFNAQAIVFGLLFLLLAIGTKLFGCFIGAKLNGYTKAESFQIGAGMIPRGEVSLIVLTKGLSRGVIASDIFSIIILVILVITLIAPLLLQFAFRKNAPIEKIAASA